MKALFDKLTQASVAMMQKYLPDSFVFCALLTIIIFFATMFGANQSPIMVIEHWYGGFWNLLSFSMQMALVLISGYAMAIAPVIKRFLKFLASNIKTPLQAIAFVTLVSATSAWINWGFGLVIGVIFSREVAKVVKDVDYRLLIASSYSGFLVWHGGLSGSIPLALASGKGLEKTTAGVVTDAIPISQTIFSPLNITVLVLLFVVIPLLNCAMHPKGSDVFKINPSLLDDEIVEEKQIITVADKLEHSKLISWCLVAMGVVALGSYFYKSGPDINLNVVNFIFLFVAILLHGNPINLINAFKKATMGASGIVLQFPFYAGIMGMMTGVSPETGQSLGMALSNFFVSISNEHTFGVFSFLSAGILNVFIPSGGGQWVIQAPIMLPAGQALGVAAAKTSMAIAWGDAWTNMIQPFWALPALGIAGLRAKDIMGYCLITLIVSGIIIAGSFLLL